MPTKPFLRHCFLSILSLAAAMVVSQMAHAQVINEFVIGHTSTDRNEYVELAGASSSAYNHLSFLFVDSTVNPGQVLHVTTAGTTDANGIWWSGYLGESVIPTTGQSISIVLVNGFTGAVGIDLDTNNDGAFDSQPWTSLVDDVGVNNGAAVNVMYSGTVLAGSDPAWDNQQYGPGGASRVPNGTDTNTVSDWVRNDWYMAGIPGAIGTIDYFEVANSPGLVNFLDNPPPVINEFVAEHSDDDREFVEILARPLENYTNTCLLVISGDSGSTGVVEAAYQAGTTDKSGYWTTGFSAGALESSSYTLLAARWPSCVSGTPGTDLDSNDDGVIDSPPWQHVYDSVAVSDGDSLALVYSTTNLGPGFDGLSGAPGGASRRPSGADTDTQSDWMRNDFDGAGFAGVAGDPVLGNAFNTPGWSTRVSLEDYYADVDASTPEKLRATLHDVIDDHRRFKYTHDATDVWDIVNLADQDPNNAANILDVYRNASYTKITGGTGSYNREHTWPSSYGFTWEDYPAYPHTDVHQIMACDSSYNTSRSNLPFQYCPGCNPKQTLFNNGVGGDTGSTYPGYANWTSGSGNTGAWETWIGRRGDVARAQLYMDLRYEGDTNGVSTWPEHELILTDDTGLIVANTSDNFSPAYMGILSAVLQWHEEDPVDTEDQRRNDVVYSFQGNRNPFVDHPEWVDCLYKGINCDWLFADGFETGDTSAWTAAVGAQ